MAYIIRKSKLGSFHWVWCTDETFQNLCLFHFSSLLVHIVFTEMKALPVVQWDGHYQVQGTFTGNP